MTSGNISSNDPRSGYINDKNCRFHCREQALVQWCYLRSAPGEIVDNRKLLRSSEISDKLQVTC